MFNQGNNQPAKTRTRFFYGYIVLAAAFIIQAAMFGPRMSFGVFFKPLLIEFGWTRALISGAFSISAIVEGSFGIIIGGINDRLGPRVVMTLCGLLVGLGYLLMSLTSAAWQLYLFYVIIIGIGMGGCYVPLMSTIARWFVKRRSVMTGIVVAGGGIGAIITPPVVNWLISTYGWRNSYIIMGALVLIIIIIAAQFLRRDPTQMGQLPYGANEGEERRLDFNTEGLTLKEAAYTKQLWMTVAMLFCFGFCIFTITVHIVPYATDIGISATAAANILATRSVAGLIGGILLGGLADRIGNRQGYTIGFILISAALVWLLSAREVWMLYLFAVILGFGGGGAATLTSPLAAELFGIRSHGLILGVIGFCHTIGAAVGPFMAGYIFDVTGSYQTAFLTCVAFAVVGLILAIILRPIKRLGVPM